MAEPTATTGAGTTPEQIHRVKEKFDSLQRSQNSTRWTSRLVAIGIAVVAILGVWIMLSPVIQAVQEPDDYQVAIQTELEESLLPAIQEEGMKMYDELQPEIAEVVRQKLQDQMPEISSAVQQETQTLFTNLSTHATNYQSRIEELDTKVYEVVQRHVPELEDQDKSAQMAKNATDAINVAVARVFENRFQQETQAAEEFGNSLRNFPSNPELSKMSEDELREHLKVVLATYAAHHFDNTLSPELRSYAMGYEAN